MEDLIKATSTHFSGFVLEDQPSSTSTVKDSQKEPFVIGVAGGTAAGKTTICNMIISQLRDQRVALVNQDLFYRVLNEEELRQAHDYNFDNPDSFDMDCLLDCMTMLKQRKSVDIPSFNHKLHQRCAPVRKVNPSDVIILEGILVFHDLRLCKLMNMKIFVDTGNSAVQAIQLLLERGAQESNIIFLNLISAPGGIHMVCKKFPGLRIVTLEIDMALNEEFRVTPAIGEFGGRRFGTEDGSQTTFNSTANANGPDASF